MALNIFHFFKQHIHDIVEKLQKTHGWPREAVIGQGASKITVEPPKDCAHGDLATNVAMVLAKPLGMQPRQVADLVADVLRTHSDVASVSIAGPGFINMVLEPTFWQARLVDILESGVHYGDASFGAGQRINVEFVSANPTGPMHTGHARNAVLGDAIAALLKKTGFDVCREYYINDAGGQIETLARSTYLRYLQAAGQTVDDEAFEGLYPGDYLVNVGEFLYAREGLKWVDQPTSSWLPLFRETAVAHMMQLIRDDLAALGVTMDVYTSEAALVAQGAIERCLAALETSGDVYVGVLERPKGHEVDDWEERPQTLFRATNYGDDVDRPLKKSDGSWTYFAGDIAYHFDKFQRGFTHMIDILGADHGGYVKRIQAAVRAITQGEGAAEVQICQLVNFMENGVPIKMSKRAGTFIKVKDVIDRVGKDVTRFMMLTRRNDMMIDFDFSKVLEQTKENPVFYVQYAYARCMSVLRHAATLSLKPDLSSRALLTDDAELEMIKVLAYWPRQVEVAALTREPHRIAFYIQDVAATFHGLWNKGKEQTELRFIDPQNPEVTQVRLALVQATAYVIASALTLFDITPMEEMR